MGQRGNEFQMVVQEQVYENGAGGGHVISNVGVVQMTGNYKKFKIDGRNRPIDPRHLMELHDAIEHRNNLREYPIVVDSEMRVLDGQHRLKAAESLNVPIYYIVSDRMSIADVANANSHQKGWRTEDYLHFHCAANKIEYLKLKRFWERHTFMGLSTALRLCHFGEHRGGRGILQKFADGEYLANDIPQAEKIAQACLDFSRYVSFFNSKTFVTAVSNMMSDCEYDHARMMQKMEYLSAKLVKCPDAALYIACFNEIYNYRVRPGKEVLLKKRSYQDVRYRVDRKKDKAPAAKVTTKKAA